MRHARVVPVLALIVLAGCSEERAPLPAASAPPVEAQRAAALAATPSDAERRLPDVTEEAIEESARGRDPFQPTVARRDPPRDDRRRKSRKYPVEQLKLVGVVTRIDEPRAMLVGPAGKGWVVRRGELVGQPEVIRGAGDADALVSWRVDRIRERDVVLVREDAVGRRVPPETRVLAMRDEPLLDPMDD